MDLEQELKEHGVNVVCSKMDTIISVHIHGASGKRLVETLQLVDTFVASKVAKLAKSCEGRIYCDPCFGPNDADAMGMLALCKHGDVNVALFERGNLDLMPSNSQVIPSKGGSQHQAKIIKMVKEDKLKWQRPIYAAETKDVLDENEYTACSIDSVDDVDRDSDNPTTSDDPVFCEEGQLFTKVPLIEKAYAKLHGCYEALIGGYIDVALSDLTGLCSEQIILKPDHPGFGDDPFAPKPGEQAGDGFWKRLLQYKRNGTLMGCSIQPDPKSNKNIVAEGSAGQGKVRLVTEPQEEVTEVNQNDGTFFMSYEDWRARYTHFFAGIDFADEWCGLRVHGNWDDTSNGGNTTKSTWINNPRYQLLVKERCHLYISMSQHDPRGTADPAIFPIGFHICTLQEVKGNKFEVKEPPKKAPPYYRLYQKASQAGLCNGTILEPIPPAIIPGSVIPGIDDDGVPQPSYTLKQAVTQPVFHLEGGQPIVEEEEMPESAPPLQAVAPSSAMQAPVFKEISVPGAAQHRQFENLKDEMLAHARAKVGIGYREVKREFANAGALRKADFKRRMMNLGFKMDEMSDDKVLILFNGMDKDKSNTIQADELLDCFMLDIEEDRIASVVPEKEDEEVPEKVNQEGTLEVHVIGGKDLQSAEIKQHTLPLLTLPSVSFSSKEALRHDTCALEILEEKPALLQDLHVAFLHALNVTDATFHKRIQELVAKYKQPKQKVNPRGPKKKLIRHDTTPVQQFFDLVQARLDALAAATNSNNSPPKEKQSSDVRKPFNWANLEATDTCGPAVVVRLPTTEQKLLHSSPYMQALETKRWTMFHQICQRKAQVFGDKQRQANLPRLIGGRKSGTNTVHCSDCNRTIVVSGKQDHDHMCMAQGCVNLFCAPCYEKMAANDKFCDDCYLHENGNIEVLGMQLRTMLMSKLAATDVQLEALDQIFHSLDENHSGDLSRDEFVHLLDKLRMHPPLTPNQIDGVFEELDVDNNGSLSFEEFKMWLLGRESMWSPRVPDDSGEDIAIPIHELLSPTREAIVHDKKSAGLVTFVQSVVDDMVTDACGMSTRSPWLFNSQPIEKREFDKQLEREHVLFQRLGTIQLMDNTMDDTGGIAKLFSKFDVNGDGSIEIDELSYLVQSIGLTASPVDLRLLAHRLRREDDGTIHLADFVTFLQRMCGPMHSATEIDTIAPGTTPSHERALLDKIIELEHLCKEHRIQEVDVKHILRNFYIGMDTHELAWMAKQLHDLIGWTVDLSMLQRIALVCTPCIFDTNDSKVVCAGDVLLALFSAPAGFAGSLASYSIQAVSDAIQHLFKIESPDVEEDLEWEKLGQLPQAEMPQAKFVECLLRRGLKLVGDSLGIESQVCVALALDTLRYREGVGHTMFSSTVTRGLFTSLSRYSTLTALEQQMRHILQQMARVGSGQQFYQTVITRGSSPDEALKVYVIDPSVHQVMMHAFHESDFSVNGVALFADNRMLTSNEGGCTPQWNFSTKVTVAEPKECIHRTDRPVVYVDTQPILGKPDSTGENLIPFTTKQHSKGEKNPTLHFVVLSVRRTVPKSSDKPTLYCTAYDPITASDYEVVGTPTNWSLMNSYGQKCTGQIELHAHFQIRTLGQSVETLAPVPHDKSIPKLLVPSSKVKLDLIVDSKAAAPSPSVKVLPSSQQLPTNSNEAALKERINELEKKLALESNMAASSDSTKWKKKYEQLKQQTTDEQAQAEKK
ncbi:hypothetical protein DYB32_002115 [Aphanomyces invadans]|uniref:Uncharacterized protein n=1 Tax=Aphanomyces invadans TaxID=157072 RepID=A0A418B4D3_9STRA|nr:hypothetical protein DYB32_002115 [Aphanomyces invadans]